MTLQIVCGLFKKKINQSTMKLILNYGDMYINMNMYPQLTNVWTKYDETRQYGNGESELITNT
jgi:hypothetical protein